MFKKANIEKPWLAYIPIAQVWPFLWTIKKSAWNLLWTVLPVVAGLLIGAIFWVAVGGTAGEIFFYIFFVAGYLFGIVVTMIWLAQYFKAFGMSPLWILLFIGSCIPYIGVLPNIGLIILYCYMGFSKDVQYHPDFDAKPEETAS